MTREQVIRQLCEFLNITEKTAEHIVTGQESIFVSGIGHTIDQRAINYILTPQTSPEWKDQSYVLSLRKRDSIDLELFPQKDQKTYEGE